MHAVCYAMIDLKLGSCIALSVIDALKLVWIYHRHAKKGCALYIRLNGGGGGGVHGPIIILRTIKHTKECK